MYVFAYLLVADGVRKWLNEKKESELWYFQGRLCLETEFRWFSKKQLSSWRMYYWFSHKLSITKTIWVGLIETEYAKTFAIHGSKCRIKWNQLEFRVNLTCYEYCYSKVLSILRISVKCHNPFYTKDFFVLNKWNHYVMANYNMRNRQYRYRQKRRANKLDNIFFVHKNRCIYPTK